MMVEVRIELDAKFLKTYTVIIVTIHCGKHNVLTCGEARYSLARLETSLINVTRNSGKVANRSGLTGIWHTESLHTPLPHLPTQIADQVTEMSGLLHYWTCVVIVGCSYCMYKATV